MKFKILNSKCDIIIKILELKYKKYIQTLKMKFKIKKADRPKHNELVAGVGWSNKNELFR
jgi:hypothetical protein